MSAYEDVLGAWQRLSRDGYIGMSASFRIVAAVDNTDEGRQALAEILDDRLAGVIVDADALSYLRISRDVPIPPGIVDNRADAYFRTRFYTGTRLSQTHRVRDPKEFLYFNYAIGMVAGTLRDVTAVRQQIRESGFEPVLVRMPDGREQAIGTVMVNEFKDTTFGPYNEVVFFIAVVPVDAPGHLKTVDYVNGFSLQVPLDRGATTYHLKLWLNELSPTDGGNDFLGTNKELGCFRFEDRSDGSRVFRSWDKELKELVSGRVPRTATADAARAAQNAYRAAAARAGTTVPTTTAATIPVASRPDSEMDKPARRWAITVDWRQAVLQEVTPGQVGVSFGESEWGRRFGGFGFTPALGFYSPCGVGQILNHLGDCPFDPASPEP